MKLKFSTKEAAEISRRHICTVNPKAYPVILFVDGFWEVSSKGSAEHARNLFERIDQKAAQNLSEASMNSTVKVVS